jgi:D-galactarolactone cycloisomerase
VPRIREIQLIPIRVTLDTVYRGSHYRMPRRCTIITRLHTDDGTVGEAYNADADEDQTAVMTIVQKEITPLLLGLDVTDVERCWDAMRVLMRDQLRDRRLVMQAIACVDSAIWDALGKTLGMPLFKLWGGFRSTIPMIGIGGYYSDDPHLIEREMSFFSDEGFVGMKFKVGGKPPKEDAARLKHAVAMAPPGFLFIVDANQAWSVDEAVEFVDRVRDTVQLRWFEEPCEWPDDQKAMQSVRFKTGVQIAAGQSEISRIGMRNLMACGSIDVANFDASWGGGPTEWRRVAHMAMCFGVSMAHHEEAHLASHLLASMPHGTFAEAFHPDRDPIYWNMLANRPKLNNGELVLPDGAGFGWELDEEFISLNRADR